MTQHPHLAFQRFEPTDKRPTPDAPTHYEYRYDRDKRDFVPVMVLPT